MTPTNNKIAKHAYKTVLNAEINLHSTKIRIKEIFDLILFICDSHYFIHYSYCVNLFIKINSNRMFQDI